MFKPTVKHQVINVVKRKMGRDINVKVNGERTSTGFYKVSCEINNELIASANHSDWRQAYRNLKKIVEEHLK